VDGRLLQSLPVNGLRQNGKVVWDQRNRYGNQFSSGMYLVRLHAGAKTFEEKIMLLK